MGYELSSYLFVGIPVEYESVFEKENAVANTPYEFVFCGDDGGGLPAQQAYIALKDTIQYITRGKYEMGFNSMSLDDLEEVSDEQINGLVEFVNQHEIPVVEDMWIGWYIGVHGG